MERLSFYWRLAASEKRAGSKMQLQKQQTEIGQTSLTVISENIIVKLFTRILTINLSNVVGSNSQCECILFSF